MKPGWAAETRRKAEYVLDTYLCPALRRHSITTLTTKQAAGHRRTAARIPVARDGGEDVFPDRGKDGTQWLRRPPTLAERLEAASAAAPYFAPRLAATDLHHEGTIDAASIEEYITPEQRVRIACEILREAGYEFDD